MTFRLAEMPYKSYWRYLRDPVARDGLCIYGYPLATVFAHSREEADRIAGPEIAVATYDQESFVHLVLDSAEAAYRLARGDLTRNLKGWGEWQLATTRATVSFTRRWSTSGSRN